MSVISIGNAFSIAINVGSSVVYRYAVIEMESSSVNEVSHSA